MDRCEICGREDLFSFVNGDCVCASCTVMYGIACPSFGEYRSEQIKQAKAFHELKQTQAATHDAETSSIRSDDERSSPSRGRDGDAARFIP